MKINAVVIAALLSASTLAAAQAQNALQKSRDAYTVAQSLESELNEKPDGDRTRTEYLKVIKAYQRVYLITPRSGYADNSLMTVARLYEEMKSKADAIKTLHFLIREYPKTPFKDAAEKDLARLNGAKIQGTVAVDNIRFFNEQNSVRIVVDLGGDTQYAAGISELSCD